jgi:hypothetical protein
VHDRQSRWKRWDIPQPSKQHLFGVVSWIVDLRRSDEIWMSLRKLIGVPPHTNVHSGPDLRTRGCGSITGECGLLSGPPKKLACSQRRKEQQPPSPSSIQHLANRKRYSSSSQRCNRQVEVHPDDRIFPRVPGCKVFQRPETFFASFESFGRNSFLFKVSDETSSRAWSTKFIFVVTITICCLRKPSRPPYNGKARHFVRCMVSC